MRTGFVAALAVMAAGMAPADPMEACRAGNPRVPELCRCAIDSARAQGIEGAQLERLLRNERTGVPEDTARRYGRVLVQCTQLVVLTGGFRSLAPLSPPSAPPPELEAMAAGRDCAGACRQDRP